MSFILLNCFLLVDSCMPRYGALLGQRERCGAGWGRMWWFGGGSEPLPAGPGASADCAGTDVGCRGRLRTAAIYCALCDFVHIAAAAVEAVAAAAEAAAAAMAALAVVVYGRWRQRSARRWRLDARSEAPRWAALRCEQAEAMAGSAVLAGLGG